MHLSNSNIMEEIAGMYVCILHCQIYFNHFVQLFFDDLISSDLLVANSLKTVELNENIISLRESGRKREKIYVIVKRNMYFLLTKHVCCFSYFSSWTTELETLKKILLNDNNILWKIQTQKIISQQSIIEYFLWFIKCL